MAQKQDTPKVDIYQRVTDSIVQAIEAGAGKWEMPWSQHAELPRNVTGKAYRGINTVQLWSEAINKGYESQTWATYNQWAERGAQVRKGEKSSAVVFWKFTRFVSSAEGETEDSGEVESGRVVPLARMYHVFNAAQVDGFTPKAQPIGPTVERIRAVDGFFDALGGKVAHVEPKAYYRPSTDSINMPKIDLFRDAESYYATLAHEYTHWTAPKHRCDRELGKRFGSEAYAAEELIAELGAAFLCGHLGLSPEPRPDHAAYLTSWLKVLKADKKAIFTASSQAQKAVDWMVERSVGKAVAA